jgi:acetoin utilization protein AcuB
MEEGIMKVKEIMSETIVTVELDDSLKALKEIFDKVKFHHLLVVESDILYGVISDRDLLKALSPNIGTISETESDLATLHKRAHQIMTRRPVTLPPNAGIDEAIEIFNKHRISCIPIVDQKRKLIGIISWRDILKAVRER